MSDMDRIFRRMQMIYDGIWNLQERVALMAIDFSVVKAQMQANTDAVNSAVQLITDIRAKLDAALALGDPSAIQAEVQAIADQLKSDDDKLAAAVVAGTPAATA